MFENDNVEEVDKMGMARPRLTRSLRSQNLTLYHSITESSLASGPEGARCPQTRIYRQTLGFLPSNLFHKSDSQASPLGLMHLLAYPMKSDIQDYDFHRPKSPVCPETITSTSINHSFELSSDVWLLTFKPTGLHLKSNMSSLLAESSVDER